MDLSLLQEIGLTKPQAMAYEKLVAMSPATAPQIGEAINETRSNAYKILDKLCELGLAEKDTNTAKTTYLAASPAALEQIIRTQSEAMLAREHKLNAAMPLLLDFYFAHSERPSIRFFQGKAGIEQVFADMLKTAQPIYLLRSPADVSFYDGQFFEFFRKKRAKLGIKTYAITPDVPSAIHNAERDKKNLFNRTWIAPDAYTANVEWDIYGDKVALISYGEEAIGVIIESKQIAESFKQIFDLTKRLAESQRTASGD